MGCSSSPLGRVCSTALLVPFCYAHIRFALTEVVTVRDVQSLGGHKAAIRERGVAVIATRPATQSPVIGGDHEASFLDLLLR